MIGTTSSSRRCDFLFSGLFPGCGGGVSCPVATYYVNLCEILEVCVILGLMRLYLAVEVDVTSSAGSGVVSSYTQIRKIVGDLDSQSVLRNLNFCLSFIRYKSGLFVICRNWLLVAV